MRKNNIWQQIEQKHKGVQLGVVIDARTFKKMTLEESPMQMVELRAEQINMGHLCVSRTYWREYKQYAKDLRQLKDVDFMTILAKDGHLSKRGELSFYSVA